MNARFWHQKWERGEIYYVAGGLKGKVASTETAWLLQKITK